MFVRMPGSPFLEDNRQSDEYVEVYLYNIPHASQFTVSAVNTPQIKPAGISITHRSNLTMIRSPLLWISSFSLMIFQPAVTLPSKHAGFHLSICAVRCIVGHLCSTKKMVQCHSSSDTTDVCAASTLTSVGGTVVTAERAAASRCRHT